MERRPRPSPQLQGILVTLCSTRQLPLKLYNEDLRLVGETPSARAMGGGVWGQKTVTLKELREDA